jgi:hypothetical protein
MSIDLGIQAIENFQGLSLTESLSRIESSVVGLGTNELRDFCDGRKIDGAFMSSAVSIKKLAGQINVIIHAAGILCSLPAILKPDEIVESVSLGAGNAGRQFDLETNFRVAEYKFIDWQGGSESIRQNGVFKDFFSLAEHETKKSKHLYVVGTNHPLRFLTGGRALSSVLSRYPTILAEIARKYGAEVTRVRHYYELKKSEVEVLDISPHIGRDV